MKRRDVIMFAFKDNTAKVSKNINFKKVDF